MKKHTRDEVREIRDLRGAIEGVCARHFAAGATDAAVDRLEQAVDLIETALARADLAAIVHANHLYYEAFTAGCASELIRKYVLQFVAMTSHHWGSSLGKPGRAAESVAEMRRLVAAIRARQPELAAAASETLARHAASMGLEAEAGTIAAGPTVRARGEKRQAS